MNLDFLNQCAQRGDIWRGGRTPPAISQTQTTGFADLDQALSGDGWPSGAITEIFTAQEGSGALRVVMPALAQLSQQQRWIAWVAPPHIPYAPALNRAGINLSRILLIHPSRQKPHRPDLDDAEFDVEFNSEFDRNSAASHTVAEPYGMNQDIYQRNVLWAAEQALASSTCSAVLMWLPKTNGHALRRLQLAAQKGNTLGFMFSAASSAKNPSPAALRILASAIQPDESQPSESQFNESKRSGIREQAVRISIMKQRGGWPGADVDIRLNAQVGHARHEHAHTTVNEKDGNYFPLRPRREVRPEMH